MRYSPRRHSSDVRRATDDWQLLEIERVGSGWRLHFHVKDATQRQLEFLHAVHKKRDQRDPADFEHCCRLLAARERGGYVSVPLELPDR